MLLEIAASITFTIWFVEIVRLHKVLRIDFKPFSCVPCLSVWAYIVFVLCPSYVALIAFCACFSSVAAAIISKILNKWN